MIFWFPQFRMALASNPLCLMLSFHTQLKVFVATAPCDLRMNFNGLWAAREAGEDKGTDYLGRHAIQQQKITKRICQAPDRCLCSTRIIGKTSRWPNTHYPNWFGREGD